MNYGIVGEITKEFIGRLIWKLAISMKLREKELYLGSNAAIPWFKSDLKIPGRGRNFVWKHRSPCSLRKIHQTQGSIFESISPIRGTDLSYKDGSPLVHWLMTLNYWWELALWEGESQWKYSSGLQRAVAEPSVQRSGGLRSTSRCDLSWPAACPHHTGSGNTSSMVPMTLSCWGDTQLREVSLNYRIFAASYHGVSFHPLLLHSPF